MVWVSSGGRLCLHRARHPRQDPDGEHTGSGAKPHGWSRYFSRTRSKASQQVDMSDRMTVSPTLRPDSTSTVFTELRPSFTWTRVAPLPSGSTLNRPTVLSS